MRVNCDIAEARITQTVSTESVTRAKFTGKEQVGREKKPKTVYELVPEFFRSIER